jgi:hypothetical protein
MSRAGCHFQSRLWRSFRDTPGLLPGAPSALKIRARVIFALPQAINYARLLQIVGRHLKFDAITGRKANESLAHFSRYMCKHQMLIREFNAEHCSGKYTDDFTFGYDWGVGRHGGVGFVRT